MISKLYGLKRAFQFALIFFLFFFSGLAMMSTDFELTGSFALISSAGILFYSLVRLWFKRKKSSFLLDRWRKKELLVLLTILPFISVIGCLETYNANKDLATVFGLALISFLLYGFLKIRSNDESQSYLDLNRKTVLKIAFGLLGGIALILLEDGNFEPFYSFSAFIYFVIIIFWIVQWFFSNLKLILNLKNEQAKSELQHLQSQVNPHFFFNTLNNLYGLIEKDSKKAQKMVLKLSDMMRYSIYDGQNEWVTLEQEVEYLQNYIDLHQERYHKKTDIKFISSIQKEGIKIMPLLYIILLENAFKHGVENLRDGAFININLIANQEEIHFAIENNFKEYENTEDKGIGLKNLKRRLELVYPQRHFLSFSKVDNVYKVLLTLKSI